MYCTTRVWKDETLIIVNGEQTKFESRREKKLSKREKDRKRAAGPRRAVTRTSIGVPVLCTELLSHRY